jgi:pyruvate kinase
MTKILSTVGPVSSGNDLKTLINNSDFIRLNMSHNSLEWHKKKINLIKKIDPEKNILVDIPGAKPRSMNKDIVNIKKGQKIIFEYKGKNYLNNVIPVSNPLPNLKKKEVKYFTVSDGTFLFKLIKFKKNKLTGQSLQDFDLLPKKGINIPYSVYDNDHQLQVYKQFINKIGRLKFDCIGLSFVQNAKSIKILKKILKNKIFISKIENNKGYENRKEIIKESDAIMIDRGDLAAEVGIEKLTDYSENVIDDCIKFGKPVIIATENLNSLTLNLTPSKSDIINLDFFLKKKVDYIMLSEETAVSKNWKNTLKWLNKYLTSKNKETSVIKSLEIADFFKNFDNQVLVIFSKRGYIIKKIREQKYKKIFLFTENVELAKILSLKENIDCYLIKFPKKNLDNFFYKNIKKLRKKIFNSNKSAFQLNVTYPRKKSRANTIIILTKKDFN